MTAKTHISKLNQRRFDGDWDHVDYCYHKILYWFYARRNRAKAMKFCRILEPILKKVANKHEAIKGEECWSLIHEVRGDLEKAITYRKSEIKLIKKLQRFKPIVEYHADDLVDRLTLLGVLYDEARNRTKAAQALQEAKRICDRARITFDSTKLLQEVLSELGPRQKSSAPMISGSRRS